LRTPLNPVNTYKNTIKTPKMKMKMKTFLSPMSQKDGNYQTLFMRFLKELKVKKNGRDYLTQI